MVIQSQSPKLDSNYRGFNTCSPQLGLSPNFPSGMPTPYYMKTGMCRFGATCEYHHPKYETESSALVTLNIFGYPLREGVQECSFYAKTGQCKVGDTCKFHHPQPAGVYPMGLSPSAQPSQQYGIIQANWPVASPAMFTGSYVHGSYGPVLLSPGVFPVPGGSTYGIGKMGVG